MCGLQGLKTGKNIQDFFSPLNSVACETSLGKLKKKKKKKKMLQMK